MPTTSPTTCAMLATGPTAPVMHRNHQAIRMITVPWVM
jgi:hypothetical protein